MSLSATPVFTSPIGYFRIFAKPPGGRRREITLFRDAPVVLSNATTSDPFTDNTAAMTLAQVTLWDNPGTGDLDWLVPDCDIDIVWQNYGMYDYDWRWEGYIASYDFSPQGFQVDLKGALFALDDYLAKPTFPKRPIPYEVLIRNAFSPDRHPARLSPLKISFPKRWGRQVPEFGRPDYFWFLKPWGVTTGQDWTGLTSRSTGAWEPVLTGHVQSLLGVMFDEGNSQWTIRNNGFRRPELYLRKPAEADDPDILEVTLGAPGVEFSGSRDFTQRANVIYGQGTDQAGVQYSGLQIAPKGRSVDFEPYAYSPLVYPRERNPAFQKENRAKERMIKFQDGLDETAAARVARSQLQRFADPGITGSLRLTADPMTADGRPFPRMLIKAGRTIRVKGLFGLAEGVLMHVTQSQADFTGLSMSLSLDSKYRDQLTVEEVKARTRDALDPVRSLQVGKYQNLVNDLVLPWSYAEGSGMLPMGSKEFFMNKLPSTARFPYEEFTTQYPPSKYPNYYVRIGKTDADNATNNWAKDVGTNGIRNPIPIRMGQAGQIKLSQIAAYDKNGNVLPVQFHVSVYYFNGSGPTSMPEFPSDPDGPGGGTNAIRYLKSKSVSTNYAANQNHPFFENAWEEFQEDGTLYDNQSYLPTKNADVIVGWGNYYEPAGYWPGRASRGADRTGKLVDESPWQWSMPEGVLDLLDPSNNALKDEAGMLFVNIYCDDQGDEPVYFLGRFFRTDPGT